MSFPHFHNLKMWKKFYPMWKSERIVENSCGKQSFLPIVIHSKNTIDKVNLMVFHSLF